MLDDRFQALKGLRWRRVHENLGELVAANGGVIAQVVHEIDAGLIVEAVAEIERLRSSLITSERFRMEDGVDHGQEMVAQTRKLQADVERLTTERNTARAETSAALARIEAARLALGEVV